MAQESGLARRGLLLLAVMSVLVGGVLLVLFWRPGAAAPRTGPRPEQAVWALAQPIAVFPGYVAWGSLYQIGEQLPSPIGWEVRYNATATLARRGSDRVPWRHFCEMLDEKRMVANFRTQVNVAPDVPEVSARRAVLISLRAIADWHTKRRDAKQTADVPDDLRLVYARVDALAQSPALELRTEAEKTRATFFR